MATYGSAGIGMLPGTVTSGMTVTGLVRLTGVLFGWLPAMMARCTTKAIGRTTTASMGMTTATMIVIAITGITTKEQSRAQGN